MDELGNKNNHEVTTKFAYELWEQRGSPLGSPEVDWLAAEQALEASHVESDLTQRPEGERRLAAKS